MAYSLFLDAQNLLPRVGESRTRGHGGNFFTQRAVGVWNELPEEVVEAGTFAPFKKHLDRYMDRTGLEGYGPSADKWD